ncbi:MAG TPA: hypothetical protein VFI23_06365 [Rhizomicrobium sp.]|nr:hypothetical protein [Rhizomicrobium sp.]
MADTKDTTGNGKDTPKPVKAAMRPPAEPMHPREIPGKGGGKNFKQPKGRNFRHQGR